MDKQHNRSAVILILVAGIASYLDAALLVSAGVALPLWTKAFQLNPLMVGAISTALTVAVACGSFVGGWLSDRFGRVTIFNVDILFVAVGALVIALAQNITWLFVGIIIAGLASGADLPTSLAVISERMSKKDYGKAISATQLFWTAGILISQFIGFLTASMATKAPQIIFGWIALVALIDWAVRVFSSRFKQIEEQLVQQNEAAPVNAEQPRVSIVQLLKSKQYLITLVALTGFYLFWNLPANTWGSFVNYFLVISAHRTQSFATLIALVANVACFAVNVWYIRVSDSKHRYHIMYVGLVAALAAFILAGIYSDVWLVFTVAYIVYSATTVLCGESLYKIWSQSFYPQNARASLTGFSYGIVRILTAGFSLITPTLMGYSPQLLMWVLAGCVVIYGGCAIFITQLIKYYQISDPTIESK